MKYSEISNFPISGTISFHEESSENLLVQRKMNKQLNQISKEKLQKKYAEQLLKWDSRKGIVQAQVRKWKLNKNTSKPRSLTETSDWNRLDKNRKRLTWFPKKKISKKSECTAKWRSGRFFSADKRFINCEAKEKGEFAERTKMEEKNNLV